MRMVYTAAMVLCFATSASLLGCNAPEGSETSGTTGIENAAAGDEVAASEGTGDHSGWWCVEHGVPEEVCAICDKSLVANFKADGDWCDEHTRPDSQCFVCHPENFDEFSARYEAKFGEKPPQPME